ncbi:phytase [Mitsuaria sp. GD03876]|uniref:phytase n=1 Tax=Mitsuaria sp. GD03876 TaxID=2975399 RepID=UPI00244A16E6|nr:phytase [Mitsuaria sp. GD03876]MDH0863747.1 phytase [Mitsuaria sp. GD03876]
MSMMKHKTMAAALALAAAFGAQAAPVLELGKGGLKLLDAKGQALDEFGVRAKRWDRRQLADGTTVALLQDADTGALRLIEVRGAQLHERARWAGPAFDVEAVCLYLEPRQQTLQAFLLGSDGLAEQWLLVDPPAAPGAATGRATGQPTGSRRALATGQAAGAVQPGPAAGQVLRQLATVPDAKGCTVRDDEATLFVAEAEVGLWAFEADAERAGRTLVAPGLAPQDMALWLEARAPRPQPAIPVAMPSAQTEPVRGGGDAADDPAIWVHPTQPARSRILGTDKKRGLAVYDLQGRETQFLPVGRINNVDLRQRVRYDGRDWDLAVATQRDRHSVVLFGIDGAGRVSTLAELPTGLEDVYGVCSARNPAGGLDVFVNDKDGRLLQMRLTRRGGAWSADTVASLKLASQPEGCVADEAGRQFFVGEEKRGLWRVALDADGRLGDLSLILPVGEVLHADVEGMAVHRGPKGAWLVVSSQGNDSYVVLDADAPHAVKGRFRVGLNPARGIDAASETDGLDVTSASLGGEYGEGLLVVQDGHKRWPMGRQNFKLVPWGEVVRVIGGQSAR